MVTRNKNKLTYNFFSLGIVQVINSLLQLLVIPYVISIIGPDGFGVVAVAQVVMFYLSVLTDYGFHQTATRDIALYRADKQKLSEIFCRTFFSRLLLCLIAFILLLILLLIVPVFRSHLLLYFTGFVFVIGQSILVNWFFQGLERMQFIAFVTLLGRLVFVALIFIYLKHKNDGFLFLFFLGIGNMVAGAISITTVWLIFKLKFIKPVWGDIIHELKDGWHIAATNLSSNTCQYANIFILSFFATDMVVGYYSIAERIFFTIRQAFGVLSQSIYPRVCQLSQEGKKQVLSFFRMVYVPFLILTVAGSILLFVFSPFALSFFVTDYDHSVPLLRIFSVISVIVFLNIPFSLVLLALNKRKSYFRVYALATILNVVANIILAYFFSATGTVIAISITEIFIMIGMIREVNQYYLFNRTMSPAEIRR